MYLNVAVSDARIVVGAYEPTHEMYLNSIIIKKSEYTDITYIKLENGFAYLAAVIDWNTKKILS